MFYCKTNLKTCNQIAFSGQQLSNHRNWKYVLLFHQLPSLVTCVHISKAPAAEKNFTILIFLSRISAFFANNSGRSTRKIEKMREGEFYVCSESKRWGGNKLRFRAYIDAGCGWMKLTNHFEIEKETCWESEREHKDVWDAWISPWSWA